jgi:hypothetical protein
VHKYSLCLYHRQGVKSAFKRSEYVNDYKHYENTQGEDQGEECQSQLESASADGSDNIRSPDRRRCRNEACCIDSRPSSRTCRCVDCWRNQDRYCVRAYAQSLSTPVTKVVRTLWPPTPRSVAVWSPIARVSSTTHR